MSEKSVWDVTSPIEKSSYLWTGEPKIQPPSSDPPLGDLTFVDLFSGCGGFSIGFDWAGFETLLGVDHFVPASETFMKNHPQSSFVLGDIRKVSDATFVDLLGNRHSTVVAAGVPCQGFSLMNRKRWDEDDRNFLFKHFIRVLNSLAPDYAILENVQGLRRAANGHFERTIARAIEEQGYSVDYRVLNAADFGVPQRRERIIFVGSKSGLGFNWPDPTHGPHQENRYVTVDEAIGDLPSLRAGESATDYSKEPESEYQKFMRGKSNTLHNHEAPNHNQSVIDKIAKTNPGEPIYPRFRQRIRLHPDRPSVTQVAGGIRPQYQLGHHHQDRGLTVRERCRIQSIPDSFEILGGMVQGRVQTGNAVPPLLAKAIADQIRFCLENGCKDRRTDAQRIQDKASQMELF